MAEARPSNSRLTPTFEDIKAYILEYSKSIKDSVVSQDISDYIKKLNPKSRQLIDKQKAKDWLEWAKRLKEELKISRSAVPVAILPNGYKGEIIDVRVNANHRPDDQIYDSNDKIRQRVARGNCFLQIQNGPHNGTSCVLYGLKKFTGGLGDDDDRDKGDNFTWKKYFTKPMETTKSIVATRKANGEAAHFSCQLIDGHFVMCGGSKNVHLIFRRKEDIGRYGDPKYKIAQEVCHAIMFTLQLMDQNERNLLLGFLSYTQYTAIFEILSPDHQHVENLSHLTGNELRFITWTEQNIDCDNDSELCTISPHVGIEIAKAFKLPTVDYKMISMSELNEHMIQIRKGYNYEGEVLYFLDDKSVIGLLKKKTVWYILCRATREKVRAACTFYSKSPEKFSMSNYLNKIDKRFNDIQTWLGLDRDTLIHWKSLSGEFLKWSISKIENRSKTSVDVADKFPVLWAEFLEETNSTDNIKFNWKEPDGSDD